MYKIRPISFWCNRNMNIKIKSIALATITTVLSTGLAQAALITMNTMSISEDFSDFSGDFDTGKPVTLASGDASWTSDYSGAVIGNEFYQLLGNGYWDSGRNGFTGLAIDGASMTFSFKDNVNYVGGFMNYYSSSSNILIESLGRDNSVLESYALDLLAPISTPDGKNKGAFRGISSDAFDIAAFRVSNGYVVLDDLTFNAAVPVPAALWLFGSGLLGLIAVARRKVRV